jgi:LuxR family maltose regulon positive regulatory protein
MFTPLLTVKPYVQSVRTRSRVVLCPRLIERLNAVLPRQSGFARKITLISAPTGFGKNPLLSEYTRVAWVSLDRGDNAPARFWAYFVAALRRVQAG